MRLDMDCVRDILLCVEENTGYNDHCFFVDTDDKIAALLGDRNSELQQYQLPLLDKHGNEKLLYHVRYCKEAGLIAGPNRPSINSSGFEICDLTVSGHELLGNIRNQRNWAKSQKALSIIGGAGLSVIQTVSAGIAEGAATAALKQLS